MTRLRVAAFQRRPIFDDIGGATQRLMADLEWCGHHGVDLAIFPECYLQGYATDRATIARRAVALDSIAVAALLAELGQHDATVISGMIEQRGALLLNVAITAKNGALASVYAKTHPNEKGFDAGADYPICSVNGWPLGVNICNDANFPEAAATVKTLGARLICYPLNNMLRPETALKWRSKSLENLQARAVETGCWVASSDVVGAHGDRMSFGCTCIVSPHGVVVAQVAEGSEGVALFDLGLPVEQH